MVKVVIIDDEQLVCDLLRQLIDWDGLGLELVGEAQDGLSGLQLVMTKNPDIAITDIRMPGIDGLEIIKELRHNGSQANFIVISGHKLFDYALNAIKYGVEDYILKPINKTEINNIIKKICDKLRKEKEEHTNRKNLENSLSNSNEKLRTIFFRIFSRKTLPLRRQIL